MPEVLHWQCVAEPSMAVRIVAKALAEGHVVVFPTGSGYALAASALAPEGVERLLSLQCEEERPHTLAVRDADEALDWMPGMSAMARRLARRCWPGPVELLWETGAESGLAGRLSEAVQIKLCPEGKIRLRVPDHPALLHTLCWLPGPLVLSDIMMPTGEAAHTAEQAMQAVGDHVSLLIDDGPSRHGRPATVVRSVGNAWEVVREGAVSQEQLEKYGCRTILFVCSGNTCRSPMAEALCKKLLAERLGCLPAELPARGFLVQSAGTSAMIGGRAAEEAVATAQELGADLSGHSSRPVTADLLAQTDHLVAMTRGHLHVLTERLSRRGPRPRLLCPEGGDVADPIGGDMEVYRQCAQQILRHLEKLLPEVH